MEKNKRELESNGDVRYVGHYDESEDRMTIETVQDVNPYLESNKQQAQFGSFDKKAPMRKMASIPLVIIEKWLREEGLDVFNDDLCVSYMIQTMPIYEHLKDGIYNVTKQLCGFKSCGSYMGKPGRSYYDHP